MLWFSYLLTIRALSSAVPVALAAMMTAGSVASAQTRTALACQQVSCPVNHSTTLTGKVFAPNGIDPLPNVLVYIPGAPVTCGLDPLPDGVPNGPIRATNSPLVSTTTAVNGLFTLTNVPVGSSIPVVIQAGKWRRLFSIPCVWDRARLCSIERYRERPWRLQLHASSGDSIGRRPAAAFGDIHAGR